MKMILKNAMLALIASISMIGTMSAQAQTEKVWALVKVSDTFIHRTEFTEKRFSTFNQACENYVSDYMEYYIKPGPLNGIFEYRGGEFNTLWEGWGKIQSTLACITEYQVYSEPWEEVNYLTGLAICEQGRLYPTKYDNVPSDGCYEWQEVIPCTGIAEDGTASPKGCYPVNVLGCWDKRFWDPREDTKNAAGLVLCPRHDVCAFHSSTITDSEAREFARECTYVHEYTHIINKKDYKEACVDGVSGGYYPDLYMDEHIAYNAGIYCIEQKQRECSTEACITQLDALKTVLQGHADKNYRNYHNWPNVDSK